MFTFSNLPKEPARDPNNPDKKGDKYPIIFIFRRSALNCI